VRIRQGAFLSTCVLLAFFLACANACAQENSASADSLRQKILALKIPGLTVTDIQCVSNGVYQPTASKTAIEGLPAFCLVALTLKPTPASNIRVELWMPQNNWNGRFLGTGNGGSAGNILYDRLANGLKKGYATANTDMGTSPHPDSAIRHPERRADFGYRSTHLMTIVSKQVIALYYGKASHHAYFVGCSTGGQQALMEAQRYPDDYNGIIAGAPANNRTHLHTGFIANRKATSEGKEPLFSPADLSYISKTIISRFAGKDGGAPSDSFLTDPRMVKFDIDSLFKCGSGQQCLTDIQIRALKKIYAGPVNPRTGEQIYCPPPPGSENASGGIEYQQTDKGAAGLFYLYRWVFGRDFDYHHFDFDQLQATVDSVLAPVLNANNPDLNRYKAAGGKLIMYTGTADALVPFQDAVNYYERVVQGQGGLEKTQAFFMYFLIPGMGHCSGGPGLNDFGQNLNPVAKQDSEHDILLALEKWVEQGVAPGKMVASALNCCGTAGTRFQRPVYPYPAFPEYRAGDPGLPASYQPVIHERGGVLIPAEKYLR
jgi:feruloyl esterase